MLARPRKEDPASCWQWSWPDFCKALKMVYDPTYQIQSRCRDTAYRQGIHPEPLVRIIWDPLLHQSCHPNFSNQCILNQPVKAELDKIPMLQETLKAIGKLRTRKEARVVSISLEMWKKKWGPVVHTKHKFFTCFWEQDNIPQHFSDSVIIIL